MSGCQWPVTPMDATPVRSWPCTHSHCHCTWAPLAAKVQWRVRGKKKGAPDQQVGKRSPLPGGGGGPELSPSWMLVSSWFSSINHFLWFPTDLVLQVFKVQILKGAVGWLSGYRILPSRSTTWIQYPEPEWWRERPDSHSCPLTATCIPWYIHSPLPTHTVNKCNKKNTDSKIPW